MKRLVIYGAGGHGKVVADIASNTYEEIVFIDDHKAGDTCMGYAIVSSKVLLESQLDDLEFFVAIGNAAVRKNVSIMLSERGAKITTLVHPSAIIGKDVTIGKGSVIMPGAILNAECKIGDGCIINTSASVDHECILGEYVHVAVGAHLCGGVHVGNNTWIGAGAIILRGTHVGEGCVIGAGAVVRGNIPAHSLVKAEGNRHLAITPIQ